LSRFGEFWKIPNQLKVNDARYEAYLRGLLTYLLDFYRRTQPLVDLDDVIEEANAQFEKDWSLHQVKGWEEKDNHRDNGSDTLDKLFCRACQKQFASDAVFQGHLKGKKHLRNVKLIQAAPTIQTKTTEVRKLGSICLFVCLKPSPYVLSICSLYKTMSAQSN
jgi:splicing factor 3A subunit 3